MMFKLYPFFSTIPSITLFGGKSNVGFSLGIKNFPSFEFLRSMSVLYIYDLETLSEKRQKCYKVYIKKRFIIYFARSMKIYYRTQYSLYIILVGFQKTDVNKRA